MTRSTTLGWVRMGIGGVCAGAALLLLVIYVPRTVHRLNATALADAYTIPQLDARLLGAQADWALDLEFALAALAAVSWLRLRERSLLAMLCVFLAAMIATKQEGLLLAGCLYIGLGVATQRTWRRTWPPLLAVSALAYAANLPWRISWAVRHLPAQSVNVSNGFHELSADFGHTWPALHLVLRLLFQYQLWLAFVPLALLAAFGCLLIAGEPRETAVAYV